MEKDSGVKAMPVRFMRIWKRSPALMDSDERHNNSASTVMKLSERYRCSDLFMVRFAGAYALCPVQLFQQDHPHKAMGKGEFGEGQLRIGPGQHRIG